MNQSDKVRPQFYFSLPRFVARIRGRDACRSENNGTEAWLAGLAFFFISYFFFSQFISWNPNHWQSAPFVIVPAVLVWLFWILALHINSLIIKVLRGCGCFRTIPIRRAQSILLGIVTTAMACEFLTRGPVLRMLGVFWIVTTALNMAAAFVLNFTNAARRTSK